MFDNCGVPCMATPILLVKVMHILCHVYILSFSANNINNVKEKGYVHVFVTYTYMYTQSTQVSRRRPLAPAW